MEMKVKQGKKDERGQRKTQRWVSMGRRGDPWEDPGKIL